MAEASSQDRRLGANNTASVQRSRPDFNQLLCGIASNDPVVPEISAHLRRTPKLVKRLDHAPLGERSTSGDAGWKSSSRPAPPNRSEQTTC
jgi:hypothetical protein